MGTENVLEFTTDNFQSEVLSADVPVLVDFWAEWCIPCKTLAPTIDEVADEFAGRAKVGKLDTEENREIAVQYEIHAIPTVIMFKGGEQVGRFQGLTRKEDIAAKLEELLG